LTSRMVYSPTIRSMATLKTTPVNKITVRRTEPPQLQIATVT
jgi:hypothetical protein